MTGPTSLLDVLGRSASTVEELPENCSIEGKVTNLDSIPDKVLKLLLSRGRIYLLNCRGVLIGWNLFSRC